MKKGSTPILNSRQIDQKIVRIAHHIHENHYKAKELTLVGISTRGVELANRLMKEIKKISQLKLIVHSIELNKDKPLSSEINYSGELKDLKGKVVVVVDDVLNSGSTMLFAIKYLLDSNPKVVATATLVDRFYRRYPIHADYVGLKLSTNLKEHVTVDLTKGKEVAYLS